MSQLSHEYITDLLIVHSSCHQAKEHEKLMQVGQDEHTIFLSYKRQDVYEMHIKQIYAAVDPVRNTSSYIAELKLDILQ